MSLGRPNLLIMVTSTNLSNGIPFTYLSSVRTLGLGCVVFDL